MLGGLTNEYRAAAWTTEMSTHPSSNPVQRAPLPSSGSELRTWVPESSFRHPHPRRRRRRQDRRSPRRLLRPPLVDDAPRRPFRSPDTQLGDRLAGLNELDPDDWAALNRIIDALLAKNRLKTIADDLA